MKQELRDGLIHTAGAMRALLGQRSRKRIIALHDIPDADRFRAKMIWLSERYDVLSLGELLDAPPDENRTQVAITFDDGFSCAATLAAPVLAALGLPAVFFVCSGYVGTEGEAARRFLRERLHRTRDLKPLTVAQLQELAGNPLFAIGGHTANHTNLGRSLSAADLEREIGDDRQQIAAWTGSAPRWFAYPQGTPKDIGPTIIDYLQTASGYEAAFTIVPGEALPAERWRIARHSLHITASDRLWAAWLNGGYDTLYRLTPARRPGR